MAIRAIRLLVINALFLLAPARALGVAAGASGLLSIVPGLGQTVNGAPLEGVGWLVSSAGLFVSGNSTLQQVGFDLWMYNMYDAYRDAKPAIGRVKEHNVFQNWIASFNPVNLWDPIGAPIVGLGAAWGARSRYPSARRPRLIAQYSFVGLGEEGLFRGFLFPALSDLTTSPFLGSVLSSALFSFVHVTNTGSLSAGVFLYRMAAGLAFCIQAHRNRYDLRKGIFAHTWFDVLVSDGSGKSGRIGVPSTLGLSVNFGLP